MSEIQLYTIDEAAGLLGVKRTTVYALMKEGRLPFVKIGRRTMLRHADIATYIEESTQRRDAAADERRDVVIRSAYAVGVTQEQLARAYSLPRARIRQIVARG